MCFRFVLLRVILGNECLIINETFFPESLSKSCICSTLNCLCPHVIGIRFVWVPFQNIYSWCQTCVCDAWTQKCPCSPACHQPALLHSSPPLGLGFPKHWGSNRRETAVIPACLLFTNSHWFQGQEPWLPCSVPLIFKSSCVHSF